MGFDSGGVGGVEGGVEEEAGGIGGGGKGGGKGGRDTFVLNNIQFHAWTVCRIKVPHTCLVERHTRACVCVCVRVRVRACVCVCVLRHCTYSHTHTGQRRYVCVYMLCIHMYSMCVCG